MQKSVGPSCIAAQNPCLKNIGTLVVAIATRISISNGRTANAVNRPRISGAPHPISTTPTNGAVNCGAGMDAFREEDPSDEDA